MVILQFQVIFVQQCSHGGEGGRYSLTDDQPSSRLCFQWISQIEATWIPNMENSQRINPLTPRTIRPPGWFCGSTGYLESSQQRRPCSRFPPRVPEEQLLLGFRCRQWDLQAPGTWERDREPPLLSYVPRTKRSGKSGVQIKLTQVLIHYRKTKGRRTLWGDLVGSASHVWP